MAVTGIPFGSDWNEITLMIVPSSPVTRPRLGSAAQIGIATAALPANEVQNRAQEAARALAAKPAGALRAMKKLMRDVETIKEVMQREGDEFQARLKSPEAIEAFRAFAERRPPDFSKVA